MHATSAHFAQKHVFRFSEFAPSALISMRLTVMFLTQKFEPVTYNRSACVLKARSLVVAMVAVQPGEFHRGKQT